MQEIYELPQVPCGSSSQLATMQEIHELHQVPNGPSSQLATMQEIHELDAVKTDAVDDSLIAVKTKLPQVPNDDSLML